ncbi:MAG: hypothetical protein ACYDCN_03645 [Bacteroidia bacterium]
MSKNKRVIRTSPPAPIVGKIHVVLKPGKKPSDDIRNAKGVYTSINALNGRGQTFDAALMSVTMPVFKASIDDYDAKQTGLHTKPPRYTSEDVKAAKVVMDDNQELLRGDVEKIARKDARNAAAIVASADMLLKRTGGRTKFVGSRNTKVAGEIINTAGEDGPHDWWLNDGVKNIQIRGSKGAKKTVKGLTVGKDYTLSSAPILAEKDGEGAITIHPTITVSTLR